MTWASTVSPRATIDLRGFARQPFELELELVDFRVSWCLVLRTANGPVTPTHVLQGTCFGTPRGGASVQWLSSGAPAIDVLLVAIGADGCNIAIDVDGRPLLLLLVPLEGYTPLRGPSVLREIGAGLRIHHSQTDLPEEAVVDLRAEPRHGSAEGHTLCWRETT